jgi:hypothetical protein
MGGTQISHLRHPPEAGSPAISQADKPPNLKPEDRQNDKWNYRKRLKAEIGNIVHDVTEKSFAWKSELWAGISSYAFVFAVISNSSRRASSIFEATTHLVHDEC